MTWHTVTVHTTDLDGLLRAIRRAGGQITNSRPCTDGYCICYVTTED